MALLSTDQIDITLDPVTGDLPAGDLTMTSGIAAVMQGATIRLRLFAGECFANLDAGVRYLEREGVTAAQALLGQPFNRAKAIREFRAALLGDPSRNVVGVPGIVSLKMLDVKYDGPSRTMTVTWQAVTEFGDTPLDLISIGA